MYKHKRILGLITARGGSKGVPDKNIRPLAGKPLMAWTIEVAAASKYLDRLILSTDSVRIANVAEQYGCDVPFMRPAELATDTASSADVVRHAIEEEGEGMNIIVLLQPTSPMRSVEDIDDCIRLCIDNECRSVASVVPVRKTPHWMFRLRDDQQLEPFIETDLNAPRQVYKTLYALNGAVYVFEKDPFLQKNVITDSNTLGHVMPMERSVDIDSELDFTICEAVIAHHTRPSILSRLSPRKHHNAFVASAD